MVKVTARFIPANIFNQLQQLNIQSVNDIKTFFRNVKTSAVRIYRVNVPVFSGTMQRSVKVLNEKSIGGLETVKGEIEIGPDVPYAQFPDTGAAPSPGAYVPSLGVRIKTGIHPGQQPQNYNEKAKNSIDAELDTILKTKIEQQLVRRINNIGR